MAALQNFTLRYQLGSVHRAQLSGLLAEAVVVALRRAMSAGAAVRLEPWVRFLVEAPCDTRSSVLADLRARSAQVEEVQATLTEIQVRGVVPLRRMLGYATPLRSMTRGAGVFEVQPVGYSPSA